ncbi:MAG: hypothetical protein A3G33_05850 [Omnitrophica bacterium RIFCSPLOWO2_12_FULL_44_17]|uniref:Ice-binding protein C-terminal domain-containing protein n=1 Tax=Candidatus Danuiimicrobium aquiferis TaxID=1801832 RepID=A0A1G1KS78_9BACT|nr:MAG: hypothetical protein A3E74_04815 [Omnitrophica bacterium RIFCSPHIGHO2_12_FULL_44_12]OGW95767.1 MAG: hypothetical protein A3G33_05850 [Omnitrophica bacterium RIFCSPLOWO2_12_FULL_44_17]OGX01746.1 MAG: hypothetical protein A3J12_06130 [Omnitrophica bacterium RIFCSPLOWO2_02_FULL_44_11]
MKKIVIKLMMLLAISVVALGVSSVYAAVPSINGTVGATEWDNAPYPYYLNLTDPNDVGIGDDNIPDSYDISRVVLLQELDAYGGDGTAANDGVYLLIETYASPSFVDLDGGPKPWTVVSMSGDFNNDGVYDIFLTHTANSDGTGQKVVVTFFDGVSFVDEDLSIQGSWAIGADGIEYFLPTGKYGTPPNTPFPNSFVGNIVYDNGGSNRDDVVRGTLVPEPSSLLLLGSSLLGLLGIGIRKK